MPGEALGELWRSVARGRNFHLQAVAREPRAAAVQRVEAAVQRRRGDLLDHKAFSNLSLCLLVELDAARVADLAAELRGLGWPVELEPSAEHLAARAGERLEGTVQVTFPEGDGELVIPLPRVPG